MEDIMSAGHGRQTMLSYPIIMNLPMEDYKSVLKWLKKSPEILKKYNDVIEDQLSKGIVEKAPH